MKGDTVSGQQLGGDASQSSKHGPPGVDDLDLPVRAATAVSVYTPNIRLRTRKLDYVAMLVSDSTAKALWDTVIRSKP